VKTLAIFLALCATASAQQIVYFIPVPIQATRRAEMSRPYFSSRTYRGGSANQPMPTRTKGMPWTEKGYTSGAFDHPKLIINPFVDQTPYKGLGEQFIK